VQYPEVDNLEEEILQLQLMRVIIELNRMRTQTINWEREGKMIPIIYKEATSSK